MAFGFKGIEGFSCPVHLFDISLESAKKIQRELSGKIDLNDNILRMEEVKVVGGADVAFYETGTNIHLCNIDDNIFDVSLKKSCYVKNVNAISAVVTYDIKRKTILETVFASASIIFPYIPGYLSFREGHSILRAISKLKRFPDVIIFDGCGIAHPRGLGLASHISLMTGIPGVGCAKSLLCGKCKEPDEKRGNWSEIDFCGSVVGNSIRTKNNVKPVYVSPGCFIDMENARKLVIELSGKYRLPEPVRLAHNYVTLEKKRLISEERGKE